MDTGPKVIVAAVLLAGVLMVASNVSAAGEFVCPYGDGLVFPTLVELQTHVATAHPGERIPISIRWS